MKIHLAVRVTAYLGRDNWDRCLVVHGTPVGSRISVKCVCEIENTKHKLKSYFELDQVRPALTRHWRYPPLSVKHERQSDLRRLVAGSKLRALQRFADDAECPLPGLRRALTLELRRVGHQRVGEPLEPLDGAGGAHVQPHLVRVKIRVRIRVGVRVRVTSQPPRRCWRRRGRSLTLTSTVASALPA